MTLQLVFFDGEEAFEEWTDTDSLYGSRHLAELMERTPHPHGSTKTTLLQAVVRLDVLTRVLTFVHFSKAFIQMDFYDVLHLNNSCIPCIFIQDLLVLLDLLGGLEPLIVSHFDNTARWFDRLIAAGESTAQPKMSSLAGQ